MTPSELSPSLSCLYETLLQVGRFLPVAGEDLPGLFARVTDHLATSLELPLVWIGRVPPGRTDVEILAASGPARELILGQPPVIDPERPEGRGLSGRALASGDIRTVEDFLEDPAFSYWKNDLLKWGIRSGLADSSPLGDGSILLLQMFRKTPGSFSGEMIRLLSGLLEDLVSFVDRQALEREGQRHSEYREVIREAQKAFWGASTPDSYFDSLVRIIVAQIGATGATVSSIEGEKMTVLAQAGVTPSPIPRENRKRSSPPLFPRDSSSRFPSCSGLPGEKTHRS